MVEKPHNNESAPPIGNQERKGWAEVPVTLARAVPPELAGVVLVILFVVIRLGEKFSETGGYVAMTVVAVVSIAYFYFFGQAFKQEAKRREQAEDASELKSRRLEAVQKTEVPEALVWSRLAVKLDLPEGTLVGLHDRLNDIQAVAFTWLSETEPGLKKNAVRVNVMLPDNRRAHYGEVCHLFIPKWLSVNMDGAPDREIRFAPTQGLVGKVFTSSRAGGVLRCNGEGERVFFGAEEPKEAGKPDLELTEWQRKILHPGLRWVLTLPLLYKDADGQARALGVISIDGIGFDITADSLRQFYLHVAEKVTVIAAVLGALPKQRVSILLQEVNA